MALDLRTLALGRAADLAPAGTQGGAGVDYDERIVEAECVNAARRTVERVFERYGPAGLMQPREGTTPGLIRALSATDLDGLRYDARPTSATDRLSGYLMVQTPPGMLRHVRLSLAGQRGTVTSLRAAEEGPEAGFDPYTTGQSRPNTWNAPRPDTLAAYYTTHTFPATDTEPPEFTSAVALTPWVSLQGLVDGGALLSSLVSEWAYVTVPEPSALTGALLDAAGWLAAALLLQQDPETLGMSSRAMEHFDLTVSQMAPLTSSVVIRQARPV